MRILLLVLLSAAFLCLATACTEDGTSTPVYSGPATDGQRIP